jgi:hypothetical protein
VHETSFALLTHICSTGARMSAVSALARATERRRLVANSTFDTAIVRLITALLWFALSYRTCLFA